VSLDPAVAATRLAVRRCLAPVAGPVVVACSGGADSLALLAATVFEGRAAGLPVLGVTIDHGLQPGSAEVAHRVVGQMAAMGATETVTARVTVTAAGQGPEAAAREARYAVLEEVAERAGAAVVLLGHTLDDQAETVLLGLARGSGTRSLAGMRPAFDVFRRPLLELTRAQTEAACRAEGIEWWTDPHNSDPGYARVRVRDTVLPTLERELGPGMAAALARTASLARADCEALDALAESFLAEHLDATEEGRPTLPVVALAEAPTAVRTRALRLVALSAGAPSAELTHGHVLALEELVTAWRGQRWVELPGPVRARRVSDGQHAVLTF
jgi:tRNA(Ile)-lysidine synthase